MTDKFSLFIHCRELLGDTNFHSALERIAAEPIPYFTQFSSQAGPSDTAKQSVHRHVYAAGLERMSSPHPSPHPPSPSQTQPSPSQDLAGSPIAPETPLVQSEVDIGEDQSQSMVTISEETSSQLDERIKQ